MENTGRIQKTVTRSARRILFGETAGHSIDNELKHIVRVDRAHLVMLAERGIVDRARVCALLRVIQGLEEADFAPLREAAAPRGIYLLYEHHLRRELGDETGGVLHTGRSRNDLNATVLLLRLRAPFLRLSREALRLQAVLHRRARRFADVVMPAYTHYQAAVPVTYGHYLAGVEYALSRDLAGLSASAADLNRCPLGAGAVGGTSLPIDTARTASLLGFERPVAHSMDAVASRDVVLRLLAAAAVMGVTLSRLAADLLLWTTVEFGFLALPDHLVGSSSMMPQKRNPYLLEHVQGRSASALGAFVHAATAMHAKPFTNSVSVGTEAVAPVWGALKDVAESALLLRLVVAGAEPQREAMLHRASSGYTTATELANRLAVDGGMSFRSAHHTVGEMINAALGHEHAPLDEEAARQLATRPRGPSLLEGLDPESVARASVAGGGPGASARGEYLKALSEEWAAHARHRREQAERWRLAQASLEEAVRNLCAPTTSGRET